jgi:hypothetical protein
MVASLFLIGLMAFAGYMGKSLVSTICGVLARTTEISIEYANSSLEYQQDQSEYWWVRI